MFGKDCPRGSGDFYERILIALAHYEQMAEEHKVFIRDMTRRQERIVQNLVRRSDELSAQNARDTAAVVDELKELTKESRAQREGLLAAIDRFPPIDGPGGQQ
jgi:hypothetical protein